MSNPEIGQPFHAADWYRTPVERENVRSAIQEIFRELGADLNVAFGPIEWDDMTPEEAPCAPPMRQFDQRGVMLLVGTAEVRLRLSTGRAFVEELDEDTLHELRRVTREAYERDNPGMRLSDEQVDGMIETIGPQTAARQAAKAVVH